MLILWEPRRNPPFLMEAELAELIAQKTPIIPDSSFCLYQITHESQQELQESLIVLERLFLLTQSSKDLGRPNNSLLIAALLVKEFSWNSMVESSLESSSESSSTSTCIRYSLIHGLDTSGYCCPRSEQKHITRGLIEGYLKIASTRPGRRKRFYLMANSKPSLLFPKSQENSTKKPLSGDALLYFWTQRLSSIIPATTAPATADNCKSPCCWIFVPPASLDSGKLTKIIESSNGRWKLGLPFLRDELVKNAIPLIDEDAMKYHFLAMNQSDIKVGDFFDSFSCQSEFRNRISAFMFVDIVHDNDNDDDDDVGDVQGELEGDVEKKDQTPDLEHDSQEDSKAAGWDEIKSALMENSSFESKVAALKSTRAIVSLLEKFQVPCASFETNGRDFHDHAGKRKKACVVAHSIQNLIKRKK